MSEGVGIDKSIVICVTELYLSPSSAKPTIAVIVSWTNVRYLYDCAAVRKLKTSDYIFEAPVGLTVSKFKHIHTSWL